MQKTPPRAIGILAGGGFLPIELAHSLRRRGVRPVILGIDGEADTVLSEPDVEIVNWGEIGRILSILKRNKCRQLVLAGGVRRPDLGAIRPDVGFFKALLTILKLVRAGGDDAVLRGVAAFFERRGIQIVGPAAVAPDLLIGAGAMGRVSPASSDERDIAIGMDFIARLGRFDVGQAVVVSNGRVEGIEGVDGTDAMLARLGRHVREQLGRAGANAKGVLIKRPKPEQELRVDMPVIGPDTVIKAAEANLAGVAVLADHVLSIDRAEMILRADALGLFVAGLPVDELPESGDNSGGTVAAKPGRVRRLGRRRLSRSSIADAEKGGRIIDAVRQYDVGRVVVVIRGHVLAVSARETPRELVERVSGQRQWGSQRWYRRRGVAVLAEGRDVDVVLLRAAARAGLAGVAVRLQPFAARVSEEDVHIANELGLGVLHLPPEIKGASLDG